MELIIAWLLFGFAAFMLARDKGKNKIVWTLLGLTIGPFALLLLAFTKTGEKGDSDYQ